MKTKKFISLCLSIMLVITMAFSGVAQAASTSSPTSSIKSGDYVYFAYQNKIRKFNIGSRTTSTVKNLSSSDFIEEKSLSVKNGWIYFTNYIVTSSGDWVPYVCRIKTNGSSYKKLAKNAANPVVYKDQLYYTKVVSTGNNYIYKNLYKMNLDGTSSSLIKTVSHMEEFTIYNSRIFYTYCPSSTQYLKSVKLDGSNLISHDSSTKYPFYTLKATNGYLYYNARGGIYRVNISKNTKSSYVKNSLLLDAANSAVYYRSYSNDKLYRKTSSSNKIIMSTPMACAVYADGSNLIVTRMEHSTGLNKILYCTNYGKNVKTLASISLY